MARPGGTGRGPPRGRAHPGGPRPLATTPAGCGARDGGLRLHHGQRLDLPYRRVRAVGVGQLRAVDQVEALGAEHPPARRVLAPGKEEDPAVALVEAQLAFQAPLPLAGTVEPATPAWASGHPLPAWLLDGEAWTGHPSRPDPLDRHLDVHDREDGILLIQDPAAAGLDDPPDHHRVRRGDQLVDAAVVHGPVPVLQRRRAGRHHDHQQDERRPPEKRQGGPHARTHLRGDPVHG
jgi:hypothetical protein